MNTSSNPSRLMSLDVLRGLAVMLVLGRHWPVPHPDHLPGIFARFFEVWYCGGWIGVDLFFVLSGFLVSGILFKEYLETGRVRPGLFFLRRGLRIYPPFYLLIAFSLWVARFSISKWFWIEALFLQGYFTDRVLWTHTWTLAIEEHFYFILGLLFFVISRQKGRDPYRWIPLLWAISALAAFWFRFRLPYNVWGTIMPTHVRIDSLFFGVSLSYAAHFHAGSLKTFSIRYRACLLIAGLACVLPAFWLELGKSPFLTRFGFIFFYLGFGAILLAFLHMPAPSGFFKIPARTAAWIGRRSYSIYLWHMPVAFLGLNWLRGRIPWPLSPYQEIAIYLAGSILIGSILYAAVEMPAMRFRGRHFPAPSSTA